MTTIQLVSHFKAGLTMRQVATRAGLPVVKVEEAVRRWLEIYGTVKGK